MPDRTALPRAMLAAWVLLLLAACSQGPAPTPPASWGWQDASGERAIAPDEAYPELFQAVQESRLFSDQKHFVDALPLREPARIRADYLRERERPGFDLRAFVGRNFEESGSVETAPPEAGADLASHISDLWPALTRHYEQVPAHSSLLPLPKPYVVPGGRFREVYYWDSYFTMLGLAESGQHQRVRDMLDNFAYLIDTYGHIPNGNRSYYLSRSQPPFFAYMVDLQARREGDAAYRRYLPQLQKEYAYWMEGSAGLRPNEARLHVVKLADGSLLNRYWDNRDTPRQESFLEDRATAARAPQRPTGEVYRDLRAGAESGWDFSSRWLDDGRELASIRTTAIVPVDLNALLYHLERTIAKACASSALKACEQGYGAREATTGHRRSPLAPGGLLRRLRLATPAAHRADQRRQPLPAIHRAGLRRTRRSYRRQRRRPTAAPGRTGHHHPCQRPAMGRAERLGTLAVGRRTGPARLRPGRPGGRHRPAIPRPGAAGLRPRRKAGGEIRHQRQPGRRRRWRVPAAGRLRLVQRRDPATAPTLRPGRRSLSLSPAPGTGAARRRRSLRRESRSARGPKATARAARGTLPPPCLPPASTPAAPAPAGARPGRD